MITLIHGPAELLRAEALAELRASVAADPALAELNTVYLDGRRVSLAELRNASDTLPFLAERRLVVVEGLLKRLAASPRKPGVAQDLETAAEVAQDAEMVPAAPRGQTEALLAYLRQVPASTELVLVEDEIIQSGPVLRQLLELQREGRARIIACQNPKKSDLPAWIRARAQKHRVTLDAAAVAELAEFVGDDLRQLDQELIKLANYMAASSGRAGGQRIVTRDDVRRLVPATRAANVFELVDALGQGNAAAAARLLQHALDRDGEPSLRLLVMIARQYRLLIQAKALQAQGLKPADIARELSIPDWTAPRLLAQAARHSFERLTMALERILAADEGIKTGKVGEREAMDILLAELLKSQ